MGIDKALAAKLESAERAIRAAEDLARQMGCKIEVFDDEGKTFWIAEPPAPAKRMDS